MRKPTMFLALLLITVLTGTAIGKVKRAKPIRHNLQAVDVPRRWYNKLASVQVAGSLGLALGLLYPPLGILTSACLVLYFGGAVLAHIRAKDPNVVPAGFFMIISGVLAGMLSDEHQQYKTQRNTPAGGTVSPTPSAPAKIINEAAPPSIH